MEYGAYLDEQDYHTKTQYIELTVLKQIIKWLVAEGLLPTTCLVTLKLKKPRGTSTYCYTQAQVQAMFAHCRARSDLKWLADVVVALSMTGLRISELAGLRWQDLDLERGLLHLPTQRLRDECQPATACDRPSPIRTARCRSTRRCKKSWLDYRVTPTGVFFMARLAEN